MAQTSLQLEPHVCSPRGPRRTKPAEQLLLTSSSYKRGRAGRSPGLAPGRSHGGQDGDTPETLPGGSPNPYKNPIGPGIQQSRRGGAREILLRDSVLPSSWSTRETDYIQL